MVESQVDRLTDVVEKIGESVLTTSETVETLASHIDQVEQQFATSNANVATLADAVRVLAAGQQEILGRLDQMIYVLQLLAVESEREDSPPA
jgi:hypothetical protein